MLTTPTSGRAFSSLLTIAADPLGFLYPTQSPNRNSDLGPSAVPSLTLKATDVVLVRHGETAWSLSGEHTGATDIPLTPAGEAAARALAPVLGSFPFARVFSSPLARARRTCELAGFGDRMHWTQIWWSGLTAPMRG